MEWRDIRAWTGARQQSGWSAGRERQRWKGWITPGQWFILASLFKSRLRQVITHESDHEVFSSWTTEETARTAYPCLAGGISWWLIQLKSLTAHLSVGPFSLRNKSATYSSAPASLGMLRNDARALRGRIGSRQNCSPLCPKTPITPLRLLTTASQQGWARRGLRVGAAPQGITRAHESGAGAWTKHCTRRQRELHFPWGQERRRHGHTSPKSQPCKAVQPVCTRWLLNVYLGVQSSAIAFFSVVLCLLWQQDGLILNSTMKPVR